MRYVALFLIALAGCSIPERVPSKPGQGSIDKEAVETAIRERKDEYQACYDGAKSKSDGMVVLEFVVGGDGKVTKSGVKSSSLKKPEIESCLLKIIQGTRFPVPQGTKSVTVTYPFKFTQK